MSDGSAVYNDRVTNYARKVVSGKTVIPFCTHAGSGLAGTADSIREICIGAAVPDGLAIKGETAQNDPDAARTAVDKFLGNE